MPNTTADGPVLVFARELRGVCLRFWVRRGVGVALRSRDTRQMRVSARPRRSCGCRKGKRGAGRPRSRRGAGLHVPDVQIARVDLAEPPERGTRSHICRAHRVRCDRWLRRAHDHVGDDLRLRHHHHVALVRRRVPASAALGRRWAHHTDAVHTPHAFPQVHRVASGTVTREMPVVDELMTIPFSARHGCNGPVFIAATGRPLAPPRRTAAALPTRQSGRLFRPR